MNFLWSIVSGFHDRNTAMQWSYFKHLGIFLRTEDVWNDKQLWHNGRGRAKLPVWLYYSLAEIEAEANVSIVVTSVLWTWERYVDYSSKIGDFYHGLSCVLMKSKSFLPSILGWGRSSNTVQFRLLHASLSIAKHPNKGRKGRLDVRADWRVYRPRNEQQRDCGFIWKSGAYWFSLEWFANREQRLLCWFYWSCWTDWWVAGVKFGMSNQHVT